jgi:hypothetical protein
MITHGPFSSGPGFTVYKDEPKTNGRGTVGPTGLSAEEELVAALIANPNLVPVAAKIGLKETHFLQETGLRGAFQFAPKGRAWIRQILEKGYRGAKFEVLERLADLEIFISQDRAEMLARRIMEATHSNGTDADTTDGAARANGSSYGRQQDQDRRAIHSWNDPDWSILDDRRGHLPEFPMDTLSPACQHWVERACHGAGVTEAHVAVPLLGIASSLIGTAVRVMASRSWSQPMTIWTATVGFSGTGKTPGIDATKRALAQIERDRRTKIADLRAAHEARVEAAKAARAAWKKNLDDAAQGKVVDLGAYRSQIKAEPKIPAEAIDPGPFVAPRLFVSNVTIERLAVLLQARPQGMLLLADELAALFLNMSRYSGGQDNEFWLEAWNGHPYIVERMGRDPICVDFLLVGMVGGLQPDKLSRSLKGDLDGMYARVLFSWPSEPPYRPLTNEVAEVEPEIVNALGRLVNLTDGQETFAPRHVSLSPTASEEFEEFRSFHYHNKDALDGREREWWAKAPANVLRLAGTLSYLAWAMVGGPLPERIEEEFLRSAIHLVRDYFWPHSRAAIRQIGLNERHANARRLFRWILARKKDEISLQDARRDALGQSLDADQTQDLLAKMEKAGWLRMKTGRTAGRSKHRWEVNPKLFSFKNAQSAESAESL